jgi:hypothetical protein
MTHPTSTYPFENANQNADALRQWLDASRRGNIHIEKPKTAPLGEKISQSLAEMPQALHTLSSDAFKASETLLNLPQKPHVQKALGTIAHNMSVQLTQDSALLKTNAAIIATLIHVVMRVKEAYDSSNAPASSPEESHYNQEQSAMTYFREIIGFSTGFLLLKRLQGVFEKYIQYHYQYEKQKYGASSLQGHLADAFGVLSGKQAPSEIQRLPNALVSDTEWARKHQSPVDLKLAQIGHALKHQETSNWLMDAQFWKRAWRMVKGKDVEAMVHPEHLAKLSETQLKALTQELLDYEKEGFKLVHKQVPLYLGVLPSVIIGGFGIEYASLHYGPVVKKNMLGLMRLLHVIPQEEPKAQKQPQSAPQASSKSK